MRVYWIRILRFICVCPGDPTNQGDNETGDTPRSTFSSIAKVESVKTVEPQGFEVSQKLVNIELTVSQHGVWKEYLQNRSSS